MHRKIPIPAAETAVPSFTTVKSFTISARAASLFDASDALRPGAEDDSASGARLDVCPVVLVDAVIDLLGVVPLSVER